MSDAVSPSAVSSPVVSSSVSSSASPSAALSSVVSPSVQVAGWAARAYAGYDLESVHQIVTAVAQAAEASSEKYARWSVEESGFGVVEDRTAENRLAGTGFLAVDAVPNWVDPRLTMSGVRLPRPFGVIGVVVPAISAIAVTYRAVLTAVITRNAVVIAPAAPVAAFVRDAAATLGRAATQAGAPEGIVQVANDASELAEGIALTMHAEPLGVVPVFVDASADLELAAARLTVSAAFDQGQPSGAESVLIVHEEIADDLVGLLTKHGAYVLTSDEAIRVRELAADNLIGQTAGSAGLSGLDAAAPAGLDTAGPAAGSAGLSGVDAAAPAGLSGLDAVALAARAGVEVPAGTIVLLAPIDAVVPEEPLAHRWPGPLLGMVRVSDAAHGIRAAAAATRLGPAGGVAVVHTGDSDLALRFAGATAAARIVVNDGGALAGTPLSHRPGELVAWTSLTGLSVDQLASVAAAGPWGSPPSGPVPSYPRASNQSGGDS